jgi:hypothetical protein
LGQDEGKSTVTHFLVAPHVARQAARGECAPEFVQVGDHATGAQMGGDTVREAGAANAEFF